MTPEREKVVRRTAQRFANSHQKLAVVIENGDKLSIVVKGMEKDRKVLMTVPPEKRKSLTEYAEMENEMIAECTKCEEERCPAEPDFEESCECGGRIIGSHWWLIEGRIA